MARRIALFGGSFDPIHVGHLIAARSVAERLEIERVVVLPSAHPPHKHPISPVGVAHRAAMVQLAIRDEPLFEFSDFDLTRQGPTFTIDTVDHFRRQWGGNAELCFVIGADSLVELATWRRIEALVERCRFVTAVRPGWEAPSLAHLSEKLGAAQIDRLRGDIVETPRIDVSSTDIRVRVRDGRSIRYLVPDAVGAYIHDHHVYRESAD